MSHLRKKRIVRRILGKCKLRSSRAPYLLKRKEREERWATARGTAIADYAREDDDDECIDVASMTRYGMAILSMLSKMG